MRQLTPLRLALSRPAKLRTLHHMPLIALRAPLAEPVYRKRATHRRRRRYPHVRVPTALVGAVAPREVQAGGRARRRRVVREVTGVAGGTRARLQEVLADGDFGGVVGVAAAWALGADT